MAREHPGERAQFWRPDSRGRPILSLVQAPQLYLPIGVSAEYTERWNPRRPTAERDQTAFGLIVCILKKHLPVSQSKLSV